MGYQKKKVSWNDSASNFSCSSVSTSDSCWLAFARMPFWVLLPLLSKFYLCFCLSVLLANSHIRRFYLNKVSFLSSAIYRCKLLTLTDRFYHSSWKQTGKIVKRMNFVGCLCTSNKIFDKKNSWTHIFSDIFYYTSQTQQLFMK